MRIGINVICVVCKQTKKPIGRSAPMVSSFCDDDCKGYKMEPFVGDLWPGESDLDFGFPVRLHGTREVITVDELEKEIEK